MELINLRIDVLADGPDGFKAFQLWLVEPAIPPRGTTLYLGHASTAVIVDVIEYYDSLTPEGEAAGESFFRLVGQPLGFGYHEALHDAGFEPAA